MGKIYSQLSIEERAVIETQLEMGVKPAAIAVALNRCALPFPGNCVAMIGLDRRRRAVRDDLP